MPASEQNRRRELERAFMGAPMQKCSTRVNSVAEILKSYLAGYELDHRDRQQSILFARGRLAHVKRLLGASLLPDLTEDAIRGYDGTRQFPHFHVDRAPAGLLFDAGLDVRGHHYSRATPHRDAQR